MPSRYDAQIDADAPNNSHAFVLKMIGWNKRVLELGAASGHMTRALQDRGCRVTALEYDLDAAQDLKQIAEDVVVADLNGSDWFTRVEPGYDVVLAGDVLEHLIDPLMVLRQVKALLAPAGIVVVSLPHVGHADLRLSLLQGRFDYNDWGLLDRTHLRFFTLKTIKELVEGSGLVITELNRVRVPAFESELKVDRCEVPTAVLDAVLADPEAETYQFVFTAIADDGDHRRRALAQAKLDLESAVMGLQIRVQAAQAEREALRVELAATARHVDECREDLQRVLATKVFRYSASARRVYGRLRRSS